MKAFDHGLIRVVVVSHAGPWDIKSIHSSSSQFGQKWSLQATRQLSFDSRINRGSTGLIVDQYLLMRFSLDGLVADSNTNLVGVN